jgi:hypothetical protein
VGRRRIGHVSSRSLGPLLVIALIACTPKEPARTPIATRPIVDPNAVELPPPSKNPPEPYPEPPDAPDPVDDGPKPTEHVEVDALLAAIEGADTIDIHDAWGGLGTPYDLVLHLERHGDDVTYRGEMGRLGRPRIIKKNGTTPVATIASFLRRLSKKRVDRRQDYRTGPAWTDDNPTIRIALSGGSLRAPLRLSVDDNRRHWQANGFFVTPDVAREDQLHVHLNQSYVRMLTIIGVYEWLDEVSRTR